jgi:phosphopantetheine--protein transferase-like protein
VNDNIDNFEKQKEFFYGRYLLHTELNIPFDIPILKQKNGLPDIPDYYRHLYGRFSLSHKDDVVALLVGKRGCGDADADADAADADATDATDATDTTNTTNTTDTTNTTNTTNTTMYGLDIENSDFASRDSSDLPRITRKILTENEINNLGNLVNVSSTSEIKLIFSLKESIYKALYNVVHRYMSFKDVEIFFDCEGKPGVRFIGNVHGVDENRVRLEYRLFNRYWICVCMY